MMRLGKFPSTVLAMHFLFAVGAALAGAVPAEAADLYQRISQAYLNGDWDEVERVLLSSPEKFAALAPAEREDVAYIRQARVECRPAWWAQCKAGQKVQIHPSVWGKPLNIAYDPAGTRGVQVQFHNSDVTLNASWPAVEMDNPAQAEHGFTKGDLNCMEVWSTLGMARVWLQTPASTLANLDKQEQLRMQRRLDFRGNVTALYYGSPKTRRWVFFLSLLTWLDKYAAMPTVNSRKAAGAMFLVEVLGNPAKYPSLPPPKALDAEGAEQKLAEYYRNRIEHQSWTVAEDKALREAIKKFAAANDASVYQTEKVTLPNKLAIATDPAADSPLRVQRDAWLKARFDGAVKK